MKHKKITIIMILILLGIIFSLNSYADPTPEEAKALAQELKDTTQVNVIPVYNEQGLVEKHFIQYQKTTETQTKIITITYQDWDKEGKRPNQQIDEYDTLIIQVKDKTNNQETTFKDHGLNGYENPENDKYLGTTDSPYVKGDVRIGDEFELYDATPAQRTQINTNYYNAMQETKTAIQQESEPVKFPEKITITDKTTEKDTTQEIPKTDIDVPGVLEIREPEEEEIFTTPKQEKQPETDKIQEGVKIPKEKSLLTEEELKLLLKEEEEKLSKLEERLKSLLTEEELKQIKEIARLAEEYEEKEKKIEKEEKLIPKQKKQEAWQKTAEAIQEAVNNIKKPEEKPIDSIKEEEKNQILEKIENEIDRAKSPKQREQAIDSIKGEIKIAVEKSEQKKLDLKEAKTDESKRIVEKSEQKQIDTITEETSKTEKKLEQKEISYPTLWKEYQEFQQTQTGKNLELTYDEYEEKQTQYIEYQKTQEGEAMQLTFEQWARSQKYAKEEKAKQEYEKWEAETQKPPIDMAQVMTGISQFLTAYEQYDGFAKLGSLFLTGQEWDTYRERVNQIFCDTILLGGTECWTSRICDARLHSRLEKRNIFSGRTPSGKRQATASIQAEKSLPIYTVGNQGNAINLWLYKVTYAINNPNIEQELKYNIQFRTDEGYKINWFPDYQQAPDYRREDNPIIEYGRNDYSEVCIIFHPSITDYGANWHGRNIREWCAEIIPYEGTATKPYPTSEDTTEIDPEKPETEAPEIETIITGF